MRQLMEEAARLKVQIHVAHFDDEDLRGFYDAKRHRIFIRLGLTIPQTKEALAHELSHCYYQHGCTNEQSERQARKRAAALLVTDEAYATAEAIDPHPHAIALELDVTPEIIVDYQEFHLAGRTSAP